jgi:hypothetical protein
VVEAGESVITDAPLFESPLADSVKDFADCVRSSHSQREYDAALTTMVELAVSEHARVAEARAKSAEALLSEMRQIAQRFIGIEIEPLAQSRMAQVITNLDRVYAPPDPPPPLPAPTRWELFKNFLKGA